MNEKAEKSNYSFKYKWGVHIERLTDNQIQNLMIKDCDKVLMYKKDFVFDKNNKVKWVLSDKYNKMKLCDKLKLHFGFYSHKKHNIGG